MTAPQGAGRADRGLFSERIVSHAVVDGSIRKTFRGFRFARAARALVNSFASTHAASEAENA